MNDTTKNPLQMIDVKYFGPSNTKGARVKLTDLRFDESITIPWDYTYNTALGVALNYLKTETTMKPYGHGVTKEHFFIVVKPVDHSFKSIKEHKKH